MKRLLLIGLLAGMLAGGALATKAAEDDDANDNPAATLMCLPAAKAMEINRQNQMTPVWVGLLEDGSTVLTVLQNPDHSWVQLLLLKDDKGEEVSCLAAHGTDGLATPQSN